MGVIVLLILSLPVRTCAPAASAELTLDAAVHNPQRSEKFVARDGARHPLEELAFFGVTPQSTVVEIWPGGGYWTEILAPFLRDHGVYYAALEGKGASETASAEAEKNNSAFREKIEADAATYGKIIPTVLGVGQTDIAPAPWGPALCLAGHGDPRSRVRPRALVRDRRRRRPPAHTPAPANCAGCETSAQRPRNPGRRTISCSSSRSRRHELRRD